MTAAPSDDYSPATKADMKMLLNHLKQLYDQMATKDDLATLKEDLAEYVRKQVADAESRVLVAVENARQDLLDAKNDQVETIKDRQQDHGERLVRLEQAAGIAN